MYRINKSLYEIIHLNVKLNYTLVVSTDSSANETWDSTGSSTSVVRDSKNSEIS